MAKKGYSPWQVREQTYRDFVARQCRGRAARAKGRHCGSPDASGMCLFRARSAAKCGVKRCLPGWFSCRPAEVVAEISNPGATELPLCCDTRFLVKAFQVAGTAACGQQDRCEFQAGSPVVGSGAAELIVALCCGAQPITPDSAAGNGW